MALRAVKLGREVQQDEPEDRLARAWVKVARKIVAGDARRVRVGQKPARPVEAVEGSFDEDEGLTEEDFCRELAEMLVDQAREQLEGGRPARFAFSVYGAAPPNKSERPPLGKPITIEIRSTVADVAASSRDPALDAAAAIIEWGKLLSKENINLAQEISKMVSPLGKVLTSLAGSSAKEEKWRYRTERMRVETNANLTRDIEELAVQAKASEMLHDTLTDIFGKDSRLWGTVDRLVDFMQARSSGDSTAPTDEEIDAAFAGVDDDMAKLAKRLVAENDERTRDEIAAATRRRWESLQQAQQAQVIGQLRAHAGDDRALEIVGWLRARGVVR